MKYKNITILRYNYENINITPGSKNTVLKRGFL